MTGSPASEPAAAPGRLETLSADECRARLAAGRIGRVVFVDGRGPVALPVNYRVFEGDVVFRTAAISSLLGSSYVDRVGFEVDDVDEERRVGWSVLVTGRVRLVDDPAELRALQELGVTPWAEGPRTQYLRLAVRNITGRRLVVAGDESSATEPA
jgi:nitroimidazol reductase NimA-like FMN-containing flavoprotein (pyridoxamine 5'-phosphate oxidase superfamily)